MDNFDWNARNLECFAVVDVEAVVVVAAAVVVYRGNLVFEIVGD